MGACVNTRLVPFPFRPRAPYYRAIFSGSSNPISANSGQREATTMGAIAMPRLDQRDSPDDAEDAFDETSV